MEAVSNYTTSQSLLATRQFRSLYRPPKDDNSTNPILLYKSVLPFKGAATNSCPTCGTKDCWSNDGTKQECLNEKYDA